jgi:hypothetical protein
MRLLWLAVVACVLFASLPAAGYAGVGFISDVQGPVARLGKAGAWSEATLLSSLEDGDRLRLGAQGHVTITFKSKRSRVYVVGPVDVTVRADGPRLSALSIDGARSLKGLQATRKKRLFIPKSIVKAFPQGLYFTSFTRVDTAEPTLSWAADTPLRSIQLKIGSASAQQLPDPTLSFTVPSNTLRLGGVYSVELLGQRADGTVLKRSDRLELLSSGTVMRLQDMRLNAFGEFEQNPVDVSPLAELLGAYVEERLDGRVLELIDRILTQRKDPGSCKDLFLRKIKILNDRGRIREAEQVYEEYLRALEDPA